MNLTALTAGIAERSLAARRSFRRTDQTPDFAARVVFRSRCWLRRNGRVDELLVDCQHGAGDRLGGGQRHGWQSDPGSRIGREDGSYRRPPLAFRACFGHRGLLADDRHRFARHALSCSGCEPFGGLLGIPHLVTVCSDLHAAQTPLELEHRGGRDSWSDAGADRLVRHRSAVDGRCISLFLILFFWQFPHFMAIAWMYRNDYRAGEMKMLTVTEPSGRAAGWLAVGTAWWRCCRSVSGP